MFMILYCNLSKLFIFDPIILYRAVFIMPLIIVISTVDINERWVFDEDIISGIIINMGTIVLAFVFGIYGDKVNYIGFIGCYKYLLNAFVGMATLFVVTIIINVSTGSLGMGDVLYFALAGSFCGFGGIFILFFGSFILAGIFCLASYINSRINNVIMNKTIAFTPFISMSLIIYISIFL
ncbi:A24 family peptidase [Peptostreptococcus canis]|uniref:Prepilin type IV endopeptidase peptidase domain-containing protein n=2 Tax=Peptostreptococcus canis TaxID=1159213 RepID=A0ABR6TMH6_9FIRM|nr:prepilin peptidase [Peptostreptococcus canis]MBC2576348.1 hypothetical protein [Peptostreptococcus canis]